MANELLLPARERSAGVGPAASGPAKTGSLVALSELARRALGGKDSFRILHFPFKVGRESRSPNAMSRITAILDRRIRRVPQLNDLYLIEPPSAHGFHISREHFVIDRFNAGFVLTDRGSACGTRVGERAVGADSRDIQIELRDGDVITVGGAHSPYTFQFRCPADE